MCTKYDHLMGYIVETCEDKCVNRSHAHPKRSTYLTCNVKQGTGADHSHFTRLISYISLIS